MSIIDSLHLIAGPEGTQRQFEMISGQGVNLNFGRVVYARSLVAAGVETGSHFLFAN
jgi:hypothetical protein